jgi:hypothetical protein
MSEELQVGIDTDRSVFETEDAGGDGAANPTICNLGATGRASLYLSHFSK